jgi:carotenoid cleavage dioxygenase-like enzyme
LDNPRYTSFNGKLSGPFTGHPHRDTGTGEHHAIAYDAGVQKFGPLCDRFENGVVNRDLSIAVKHGPYIHDCVFTARFVIVLDLPVTFSMRPAWCGHLLPYCWNSTHHARVGLLPRIPVPAP